VFKRIESVLKRPRFSDMDASTIAHEQFHRLTSFFFSLLVGVFQCVKVD
jgi:hypothetical protein